MKNKILTTVIVVAIGGVTYHIIRRKSDRKKRRAKRAGNGARLEVVVIAGSPSEPLTRSISLDLERRGFIVYIVCNTIEEEVLVQNESRPDIKPLMIDIVDVSLPLSLHSRDDINVLKTQSASASIERFIAHLQSPHSAFQGAKLHHLTFRSLILIPSASYPSSPIATLPPSALSDLLNTRLLTPILTLQTFLPLLQSLPLPHPHLHGTSTTTAKPSVLVLTPSIISSLNPAFHLPESACVSALTAFTNVLSSELAPLDIPVTHLQLGTFDLLSFSPHNRQLTLSSQRAETLKWDDTTRQVYSKNYITSTSGNKVVGKGSSLRELNNAVFDSMTSRRGGVVRVGMGSAVYGFVGRWVPRGLVAFMMGNRKVGEGIEKEFGRGSSPEGASSSGSSASGTANVCGLGESEYISVYGEPGEPGFGQRPTGLGCEDP
jgi:NAD(P)-dependent dehydrogenase (short-subunit alcohol dehydrogenase family)